MVSRFNNAKTDAPTFILVQENESGVQGVTIQVKYCPWCGERLDGRENDSGLCEPKRGGNLPEKYLAFVRRVLNDKAIVPATDVAPARRWIPVSERLPEPETEVFAVCNRNGYRFVCPAIYENGKILTQDSAWNWYELEGYGTYNEEADDYFVPEGWWENRQFTPDDVYNNPVDCIVTHWMPLPEPPKMDGDASYG